MIQGRFVVFILGIFLSILSVAMAIPALMDLLYRDPDWVYFAESATITGFVGILLALGFRSEEEPIFEVRETFILTVSSWVMISAFASLPFILSSAAPTFTDAFFEAISGLTTTGVTVFRDLDYAPPGILLWRALLQWLGGIGIVVMAMTILPALKIGGMQLFRSEFSDRSEKYFPRVSQITSAILSTYLLMSALCGIAYWLAGMTPFQSICLMMSTVSTAGFATSDLSLGYFDDIWIESIAIVFMIMGSITLLLFTRLLHGDPKPLFRDSQVRVYVSLIAVTSALMAVWLWWTDQYDSLNALRYGTFAVVSIASTTGFTTADFNTWGSFGLIFLFLLMFVGGCTGSTAGGIKIFRYQILFKAAKQQILQLRRPHGVFVPLYNDQRLKETDFMSVLAFFALYIFCYAALALSFALCGLDVISSLSGSATILGNVGPGLGAQIGPSGNFGTLSETAKWLTIFGMLLGRLELLTLLILFTPHFWRT
ncbi:MAG: TrkH family potassium uptake protein [Alphaproteobacteria bacterium]|nr:TrkH family potassium uptake protein [Alphaproteobacteria bacterium]